MVVLLVNAQLTWWIIYTLRENRTRLQLERKLLASRARLEAVRVASCVEHAAMMLRLEALGRHPGSTPAHMEPVFRAVTVAGEADCIEGWFRRNGGLFLRVPGNSGCLEAAVDPAWLDHILEPAHDIEFSEPVPGIPGVALTGPFEDLEAHPSRAAWNALLETYRRRILMVVSEGTFFAVMLLVVMWLLWKTVRREVELERQHQNFLSAITHELKSPLAAMRLSLETVLRGRADSGASVRFLENALQDTERLQSLVEKVLEVTRYGLAGQGLTLRRTELSRVVEEAVARFRSRAQSAGARVELELQQGVWTRLDEEAFPIVISNLLENAVKYGGTIPEVRVRLHARDGKAVLEVEDNGRGIPEDDLPFIFNRFFRGGEEMTRTAQGTGLGLHLVQQIVTGHGGTVEVAATGETGTTFRIVLPEAEVEAVESEEEAV